MRNVPVYGNVAFSVYAVNASIISDPVVWSETHVSSSGGGGYVHPVNGGHVSAPSVSSGVIQRERYFVRTDHGTEYSLDDAVAGRLGSNIAIISGQLNNGMGATLLATYNYDTKQYLFEKVRYKKLKWAFFGLTHVTGFIPVKPTLLKNILLFFMFNIISSIFVSISGLLGITLMCTLLFIIIGETVLLEKKIDSAVIDTINSLSAS